MRYLQATVSKDECVSFFACLVLGTLAAVKAGTLSPDVGIWGLGRPRIRHTLKHMGDIPLELLSVLERTDELSILQEISLDQFNQEIEELMEVVKKVIATSENPVWSMELEVLES